MALPILYFLLSSLSFLPIVYLSCPVHSGTCGGINITFPFFLEATDYQSRCTGKYMIQCHNGSVPVIYLDGRDYAVRNISYDDKVLTVHDQAITNYLSGADQCGFLTYFTDPIHHFHLPDASLLQPFNNPAVDCFNHSQIIFRTFLPEPYGFNDCIQNIHYYWYEPEHWSDAAYKANCVASHPTLFEWALSFSEADGSLSLQSAGFSRKLELQKNCFSCQCDGSSGPVQPSSCFCTNCKRKSHKVMKYVLIGSIVGAFVFVCLLLALFFCQFTETSTSINCIGNNLTNNQNIEAFLKEYGSAALKRYTYSEVKKITNAFKEKLGQGGYGTVFKGILRDGQVVAVKILKDSKGDGEEFINEVASISRTSHVNIVTLLGFCIEGSRRALIYDFMCNGSLEKLLSEKPKTNLEWEKLYQIAIGIARGLEYLHRGCNTRIVHFDIKPHNILLDEDFRPKISDFGLAKLCLQKESIISIASMRGTVGYIAPEVFSRNFGVVSSKSDVYSYGMMLLEMAEGRENPNSRAENNSDIYFPQWIYEHLDQKGGLLACGVTAESEDTVRKMILVGLWCIQTMPQNRPSMSQVIEMLEGSTNDLHVPPKPCLSSSPFGSLLGTTSIQDTCGIASSIQSIVVTS